MFINLNVLQGAVFGCKLCPQIMTPWEPHKANEPTKTAALQACKMVVITRVFNSLTD